MFWPNMRSFTGGAIVAGTLHTVHTTLCWWHRDLQPFLATPQDICLQTVLTAIYNSFQTCWVFLTWKEEHQNFFILSSCARVWQHCGDCLDAETININIDEREVRDEMENERIESVKDCSVWRGRPSQARNCSPLPTQLHLTGPYNWCKVKK